VSIKELPGAADLAEASVTTRLDATAEQTPPRSSATAAS
jgi:hypothetical protein